MAAIFASKRAAKMRDERHQNVFFGLCIANIQSECLRKGAAAISALQTEVRFGIEAKKLRVQNQHFATRNEARPFKSAVFNATPRTNVFFNACRRQFGVKCCLLLR